MWCLLHPMGEFWPLEASTGQRTICSLAPGKTPALTCLNNPLCSLSVHVRVEVIPIIVQAPLCDANVNQNSPAKKQNYCSKKINSYKSPEETSWRMGRYLFAAVFPFLRFKELQYSLQKCIMKMKIPCHIKKKKFKLLGLV